MNDYKLMCPECGKVINLKEDVYHLFRYCLKAKNLICPDCDTRISDWSDRVVEPLFDSTLNQNKEEN